MREKIAFFVAIAFLAAAPAVPAELAGVKVSDATEVAGRTLVLNGLGLREYSILKVDVYVGALYLESKSNRADAVLGADAVKRVDMHFVRSVGKESLTKAWTEGFERNSPSLMSAVRKGLAALNGAMSDVAAGDVISLSYVPGQGTTVTVKGKPAATIEGEDFAKALFGCWFGPEPPTQELKAGLLGLTE